MLEWNLRWGSEVKTLLEIQASTGVTPQGLLEKPALRHDVKDYWEGFWILHNSRGVGFSGPNPISVSEVQAYLCLIEEDRMSERLRILRIVQSMDSAYLSHVAKKQSET